MTSFQEGMANQDVPLTAPTTEGRKRKATKEPAVKNPISSRGPGHPKGKKKEGMVGSSGARGGHRKGQKRYKSMASDFMGSQQQQP